jgi:plastocyanin
MERPEVPVRRGAAARPGSPIRPSVASGSLARVITVAALTLPLAACGSGSASPKAPTAGPPGTIHVVMQNISFQPATVHAKVGQTVTWTNEDDAPHNVTYVSGPRFTSAATFTNGHSFTLKLTTPGTISYRCTIHPGMHGTIVVAP